ncbi:MAG: hypothetical protein NZ896_05510 [Nitrososphaerales archaeon]|nr:hypothetical protein [Nitrososphaerales archaeon]
MNELLTYLFLIGIFLSFASIPWYFKMRRKMIKLIKRVTEDLEKSFKPKDKEYVLLGYLVGYRAKYILDGGDKAYLLLTTAPRHSLLYYPFLKAFRRKDRLNVAIEFSKRFISRELHAINTSDKRSLSILAEDLGNRLVKMSKQILKTSRGTYTVYYENPVDVDLVMNLVMNAPTTIYKLSAYSKNNMVEVAAEVKEGATIGTVTLLKEFSVRVTKPSKS